MFNARIREEVMKQVRIGVIGVTGRGSIAESWRDDSRALVAAGMDVSDQALDTFRATINPDAAVTKDVDELLAMDDIEAVAVTSPDFTHEEYVIKAFQAGKHVFCEKPMATTTAACDRMLQAWRESGKHFMIGFNMRYMNIFRVMKEIVDSGAIGEIKVVWCRHFVGHGGEWYYHDWHGNSKNSTGLLLQKAAHDIDMIHWITGQYTAKVSAFGSLDYYGGDKPNDLRCPDCAEKDQCAEYQHLPGKPNKLDMCVFRREIDVEDNSTVMMELNGGIHATYMQCHYTPDYCRNYTFIGTEGRVENLDDENTVIVKTRDNCRRWTNLADRRYDVKSAAGTHGGADPVICRDFIDMLIKEQPPLATPLAGRMSVAAGCAATESIRNGSRVVDVPPLPTSLSNFVF
jgi:predicted dehydrogenase